MNAILLPLALAPLVGTALCAAPSLDTRPSPAVDPASQPNPAAAPQRLDERGLRRAWSTIEKKKRQRKTFVKSFLAAVEELDTPQMERIRALAGQAVEPEEPGDPEYFDPKVHARKEPVRRKVLKAKDDKLQSALRALGKNGVGEPRLPYEYDWRSSSIVQVADPEDPELLFHNALAGLPPGFALARAEALRQLDTGLEPELMGAFGHTYTDREGKVYPGITLYDAWGSGLDMEMPDVDTLGLVHTLLDDWDTWEAPVQGHEQEPLYRTIGKEYARARAYREPREVAVECLLRADPPARKGYDLSSYHGNFHALWALHGNDPVAMGATWPNADGWRDYIDPFVKRCKTEPKVWDPGIERKKALEASEKPLREALIQALREAGALD